MKNCRKGRKFSFSEKSSTFSNNGGVRRVKHLDLNKAKSTKQLSEKITQLKR